MTEPTEIMARAICAEDGNDPDVKLWLVDDWHPRWWYNQKRAQAAITALKAAGYAIVPIEPTEAMNQAMEDESWNIAVQDFTPAGGMYTQIYRAAIQAAQDESQ